MVLEKEVKKVKSANLDRDGWTQCMKADLQNKYNYLQLSQTKKKDRKRHMDTEGNI